MEALAQVGAVAILDLPENKGKTAYFAGIDNAKFKQMVLPDYTMGAAYAMLNQIRAAIRETEVAACTAFHVEKKYVRGDIIEELNRLSSALHIMMCKYLAGEYEAV